MLNTHSASASKHAKISCRNCLRLTKIGGEMLCYREGKITRLTASSSLNEKSSLLCAGWQPSLNSCE